MTLLLLLIFDWLAGHPFGFHAGVHGPLVALAVLEFHFKGWVMFAALMRLRDALKETEPTRQLSREQVVLGRLLQGIAIPWDVLMNVVHSVLYWEPPFRRLPHRPESKTPAWLRREWLLSQRLERLVYRGDFEGWRYEIAYQFRKRLLDNVDSKGIHRAN